MTTISLFDAIGNALMNALTQQGFRPELDECGDIRFKWEGKSYCFDRYSEDPSYVRLMYAAKWPSEEGDSIELLAHAASRVNVRKRGAKVAISDEAILYVTHEYLTTAEEAGIWELIERRMTMVKNGIRELDRTVAEMKEQNVQEMATAVNREMGIH